MSHFSENRNCYYRKNTSENKKETLNTKDEEYKRLTTLKIRQKRKEETQRIREKEANIRKENEELAQKQREEKARETEYFSKALLKSFSGVSAEEVRDITSRILLNDNLMNEVIKLYTKSPNAISDLSDQYIIVRNSLLNVLDLAVRDIEKNHMEFHRDEPVKTMSR